MGAKKHSFSRQRRFVLAGAALGVGTAYALHRGIRYPTIGLDPGGPKLHANFNDVSISALNAIIVENEDEQSNHDVDLVLRAFAPNFSMTISATAKKQRLRIRVQNVHPAATLTSTNDRLKLEESKTASITRSITLDLPENNTPVSLAYKVTLNRNYHFAAIGDTGGNKELGWCLDRAYQLGAEFLLHLGDFNYADEDYVRAVTLFNNAELPTYIAIGNHDFHARGHRYGQFLKQLGPLNYFFDIGQTRFINLDTAADTFPFSRGQRGKLLSSLKQTETAKGSTIVFTHRPFFEPEQIGDETLGSKRERNWLLGKLLELGVDSILSGHFHIYERHQIDPISHIIAGQGLGHQDLLTNSDYSKMLIGNVNENGRVDYATAALSLPMQMHCHPRLNALKKQLVENGQGQHLADIEKTCSAD